MICGFCENLLPKSTKVQYTCNVRPKLMINADCVHVERGGGGGGRRPKLMINADCVHVERGGGGGNE